MEIFQLSIQQYAEHYLGGLSIASRIYLETVGPEIKAFDPGNQLIFMTGPLVGSGTQAAKWISVVSTFPITLPEGYCSGNVSGFFTADRKKAEFDGLVIEGRATKPVYS